MCKKFLFQAISKNKMYNKKKRKTQNRFFLHTKIKKKRKKWEGVNKKKITKKIKLYNKKKKKNPKQILSSHQK